MSGSVRTKIISPLDVGGHLTTIVVDSPPLTGHAHIRPHRDYLRLDGALDGATDMRVDGSVNPKEFSVTARPRVFGDLYIGVIMITLADAFGGSTSFANFGAATPLANGCKFIFHADSEEVDLSATPITSNFELIRAGGGDPAFGNDGTSFRLPNAIGTSEALIQVVDFKRLFGVRWGIRLRAGGLDHISIIVRDDIASKGIDEFTATCSGVRVIPPEFLVGCK